MTHHEVPMSPRPPKTETVLDIGGISHGNACRTVSRHDTPLTRMHERVTKREKTAIREKPTSHRRSSASTHCAEEQQDFMASHIVTYLRRERRNWKLTQRELATLVGLSSRTQISAIECGLRRPTARELLAFQLIFGMTAHQLFPHLARSQEQHLLRNVSTVMRSLESHPTRRAHRALMLLRHISSRAVMN